MKKLVFIFLSVLCFNSGFGQDITGQWNGALTIREGYSLRLIFHISRTDTAYTATMDSPDQQATGMPVSRVTVDSSTVRMHMDDLRASYSGVYTEGVLEGTFTQAGQSFPLRLTREPVEKPAVRRPQEPVAPLPYRIEEIRFPGGTGEVELAGTLTLPEGDGPFPIVVLISGSGPQNRDEELMGHKPFMVLADHLTRQGIGVLRYDDRGFGESTGDFDSSTSLDFADDAEAAVRYLKSRPETGVVGLAGHSEGGLVAPIVASRSDDVGFIVLLAGPGVPGEDILLQQIESIGKVSGLTSEQIREEMTLTRTLFSLIKAHTEDPELATILRNYLEEAIPGEEVRGMKKEELIALQVSQMTRPWFRYFLVHDPSPFLQQVTCPVLAVNGSKDVQVVPSNLAPIAESLRAGGNQQVTTYELDGLNHLFQECETGAISEYASITQTFSPEALSLISDWILTRVK